MLTSTCFILKLNGAHLTRNTTKLNAIMLIIGKTSGENHTSLIIILTNCVPTGKQVHLSASMRRVAHCKLHAWNLMAGKNKNIILSIISFIAVDKLKLVKSHTVHIIILKKTKDNQLTNILNYFPKTEEPLYNKLKLIKTYFLIFYLMLQVEQVKFTLIM